MSHIFAVCVGKDEEDLANYLFSDQLIGSGSKEKEQTENSRRGKGER